MSLLTSIRQSVMNPNRVVWGLVLLVLAGGSWVALRRGQAVDYELRAQLLSQAVGLARTISPEQVKHLSFTAADKTNASFLQLRQQMIACGRALELRSIYSQALRNGALVFGPENLAEQDPSASPPGTVYQQPSAENLRVFRNCQPFTQGPVQDEYGTFVSAYAPVKDPRSGEVLMVIGLDKTASDWNQRIRRSRMVPSLFTAVLISLLLAGRVLLWWRVREGPKPGWLRHTEAALAAACGLILTWALTLWAQEREARARHDAFLQVVEKPGSHGPGFDS